MKKNPKHVLIVGMGSLLYEGLESLLMHEPELQVATVTYSDLTTALKHLAPGFPDVIVLSECSPLDRTRTSELLHGISPQKTLRVIVIRPDSNILDVYDKQCLKATRNDDLINLIRYRSSGALKTLFS